MITIKLADITEEDTEAIVNAANTYLAGGGGVDGAIHRAAGPSVMRECVKIGGCRTGDAVITNAGRLKAKKIIHTAGPVWKGGSHGEEDLLRSAYKNSFLLAQKHNLKTIAFPAISTGVYGYPVEEAAGVALDAGRFFDNEFEKIRYVCFSQKDFEVYNRIWQKMEDRQEMKSYTQHLWFNTKSRKEFINITPQVEACLKESGIREGLCLVNSMHITSSVFINDDEDGLHNDFDKLLEEIAPHEPISRYRHNLTGEDNGDAHLKRTIMGREVVVAVTKGKLDFGPWEQIFYGEFDGQRRKRVMVKIIGE